MKNSLDEPFRKRISKYKNRMDYWKKWSLHYMSGIKLVNFVKNKLVFLSSPFQ